MHTSLRYGLLASVSLYGVVTAATCTSNLLIDDFSNRARSNNNLGRYTSDDGSMKSITVEGTSLILTPRPPAPLSPSYYYENIPCTQAVSDGYTALSFTIKAPSKGSNFTLEIQTSTSCDATTYTSDWQVVKDLTGDVQTVTIPLAGWHNAQTNLNAVKTFNWATWTSPTQGNGDEQWQLGDIMFVCDDAAEPTTSATSSDVAPTSTSISSVSSSSTSAASETSTSSSSSMNSSTASETSTSSSSSMSSSTASESSTTSLSSISSSSTSSGFVTSTITPTSSITSTSQSSSTGDNTKSSSTTTSQSSTSSPPKTSTLAPTTSKSSTISLPPSTLKTSTMTSSPRPSTMSPTSKSSSASTSKTSSASALTTARSTTAKPTPTPPTPTKPPQPTPPQPTPPKPTPTKKVFCIFPGWCFPQ
ncbi:hypothetical protein PspLS_10295 [Pyricularia sp. CBS 133598]|nr:hypothetical protein PspLS_10295 [Pyricularia sp. CBS 133598]